MAPSLTSCLTYIRYTMFAFNFLFWMVGCALVGIGIWVIIDAKRFLTNYHNNVSGDIKETIGVIDEFIVQAAGIAIIVIGGMIMISGFLGCCGALRESQSMLTMFFIKLFLIFVALVAIGSVAIVKRDWVKDLLAKTLRLEGSANKLDFPVRAGNTLLAYGYRKYGCCGIDDMDTCDKTYPPFDNAPNFPCGVGMQTCHHGCLNVLWGVMCDMAIGAGVAAVAAGVIIVLGMTFSLCMCCAIRQKNGS